MKQSTAMAALMLTLSSPAAWGQGHNFESIRSASGPGSTTAEISGFRNQMVELNNSIVGDDTSRTKQRDANRSSVTSGSAGSGGNPSPQKGSPPPKASAKRFVCTIYCKSGSGPTTKRTFTAMTQHDAAVAAGDAADKLCQEAGQPRASSLSLPDRQCVEQ